MREKKHRQVSTESAGVVWVGGGARARPASRARRSVLKDLLTKGYRCLALLEELGARPLLRSAAAAAAASGGAVAGGEGQEFQGEVGRSLKWRQGKLIIDAGIRERVSEFNPFYEVGIVCDIPLLSFYISCFHVYVCMCLFSRVLWCVWRVGGRVVNFRVLLG